MAEDEAGGREVRPLDDLHKPLGAYVGIVDHGDDSVDDLAEVVWWYVGGHANRDAAGAVDEQVWELARQDRGLLHRAVDEIDCFFPNVVEQLGRHLRQPGLGIPHGCGAVAVDRAEVAMAIDELVPV